MRLYDELAEWWPLLSAPGDYVEEAEIFRSAIEATSATPVRTVLELGSGGGNNASHLKKRWRLTLSDRSPGMVQVSARLNPECEHAVGDMRTLRLGRLFDAVFVHDAVMYLASEADLRAAVATARAHLAPGGVALFVPDDTKETWRSVTSHGGRDGEGRSLRYLSWSYDSDPTDDEFLVAYAFLLREGDAAPHVEQDLHREGLFSRRTWLSILEDGGFLPRTLPFRHSSFAPDSGRELFLGVAR